MLEIFRQPINANDEILVQEFSASSDLEEFLTQIRTPGKLRVLNLTSPLTKYTCEGHYIAEAVHVDDPLATWAEITTRKAVRLGDRLITSSNTELAYLVRNDEVWFSAKDIPSEFYAAVLSQAVNK